MLQKADRINGNKKLRNENQREDVKPQVSINPEYKEYMTEQERKTTVGTPKKGKAKKIALVDRTIIVKSSDA